ncbi:MAG: tRNA dihydrouridine synthase DusB [Clostridia bacterium]|nr:tRNA dihydrouridine synthase DusB [Clostridia bacterium]
MYIKKLKIGEKELENNLILAPMAGITDLPFRKVCKRFNPALVCTEMVSSKAIYYNDQKTKLLLRTEGEQRPISMQIFGSEPETMGYATKEISKIADIVDINMGCPAPKVVKNGDGSKLLLDLPKAKAIIEQVVANSEVPVTLKFRKGWNEQNIVACELAQIAQDAGVSAITIHGRTREDFYGNTVDLEIIKQVKQLVKIPVIGNGDIKDEESALKMFEYTGVDGIMIGRASIGNPWIFRNIKYFLETGKKLPIPKSEEKIEIIKEHINLAVEEKGENIAIKELRKHMTCYIRNMKDATKMREYINKIDSKRELIEKLEEMFKNC